jgi:plastocyanin
VSVLNGHIHQVMRKVEGHVSFHTAMSTAFPQPAPGAAPSPGPMTVEAARLKKLLGLSRMSFHDVRSPIAITDVPLDAGGPQAVPVEHEVRVDNFAFTPAEMTVPAGTTISWTNHDDVPHRIVAVDQAFKSPVLDTDGRFSHTFEAHGSHEYFCSLHPKMTGTIAVV